MSEVKHTPGPWAIFSHNRTICIDNRGGDGRRPCVVDWPGFDGNDLPHSENFANALLIAAAPDLLEVLKEMLPESNAEELHCRPSFETCEKARGAIAKAEGRS